MITKVRGMAFAAVVLVSVVGQAGAVKAVAPDTKNENRVVLNRGVEDSTTDTRLDKKITLKMENKRLPKVLAEVSKQTGVDIHTDQEARFWSVRQRKVTVFAKDMPLRQFMKELKALLGYHIRTAGKADEPRYIVWQDLKGRKIEQDMLDAQKREKEAYKERSAYETISDAKRALSMSPEEVDQAKKSDPWLAYLATDPEAKLFCRIISEMSPRDLMKTGTIRLSSAQQEALAQFQTYLASPAQVAKHTRKWGSDWTQSGGDLIRMTPSLKFRISNPDDPFTRDSGQIDLSVRVEGSRETIVYDNLASFTVAPSSERAEQSFLFRMQQEGMTEKEASIKYFRERGRLFAEGYSDKDINRVILGQPVGPPQISTKEAKDPTLAKTYKLEYDEKRDQGRLRSTLEELAKQTNCNVMYECFPILESGCHTDGKQVKLIDILDKIAKDNRLNWEKDGNTIRFRLKDWAERRSWEISNDWVEYWYQTIKKNNGLNFDQLAEIATQLTDAQLEHNFEPNSQWPTGSVDDTRVLKVIRLAWGYSMKDIKSWLEFYDNLPESAKRQAWTKDGLPLGDVPTDKWPESFGLGQPQAQDYPFYDGAFVIRSRTLPSGVGDQFWIDVNVKAWMRDLPEDIRKQKLLTMRPEQAAAVDEEPTTISIEKTFQFGDYVEEIKKRIAEIEKSRKEAAAKETKETTKQ